MKCYCDTCKVKNCELRDQVNFCEDCAEYDYCTIHTEWCDGGYEIECNNGFELDEDYNPFPEHDDYADYFENYDAEADK